MGSSPISHPKQQLTDKEAPIADYQKLHYSIVIDAPREHVYQTMLDKPTYNQWTKVFAESSDYAGSWDTGSTIKFTDGSGNGMIAIIAENRPNEFVSIKHGAMVENGKETKIDPPAYENYTFTEQNGKTTLDVDIDMDDKYVDMFNELWPKALEKLKEVAESTKLRS